MKREVIILLVVVALALGGAALYLNLPKELGLVPPCENNISAYVSDSDYINMAKNTLMAKKFLERYPNASAEVERSEDLSVVFVAKNNETPTNQVRFKILINETTNWPQGGVITYNETWTFENDTEIDPYLENRTCIEGNYQ
jgi:hypothetical protein